MTETEIEKVTEKDDMIIQGYAFTKENDKIKVLNLHNTDSAALLDPDGEVLETSMCEIETVIVKNFYSKNCEFLD